MDAQKQRIAAALAAALELPQDQILGHLGPCRRPEHGDLSFPCFAVAKDLKKNPAQLAGELVKKLQDAGLGEIANAGPFLNFRIDQAAIARDLLTAIQSEAFYGGGDEGQGQRILIDYSSPNIAKPFGIGHLRSTVIGRSLKRLFEARGYEVIGINHLGDWGTQFGLMIAAWKRWGSELDKASAGVNEFYELYKRINALKKEDPAVGEEAKDWFRKLEGGDPEAQELWTYFRETSLNEFKRVYKLLGVDFEHFTGEAFYNDKMDKAVERLEASGLTEMSEGALIVDLEARQEHLGKCLLRKDDGATLYATRDITAALYRLEHFKPAKVLYVVGVPQSLHFRQFFKVLELLGAEGADGLVHVAFGHYKGMSTRGGTLVFLQEVLDRTSAMSREIAEGLRTREQIELTEEEMDAVAEKVGIGAVVFADLKSRRIKDIEFSMDRMLNLKGDTGPYVQWTYARCCGIQRKNKRPITTDVDFALVASEEGRALFKALGDFPRQVERAIAEYEPSYITGYLLELAAATNAFVHVSDVIHSEDALRDARALAIDSARKVLGHGLYLLGIEALEKM